MDNAEVNTLEELYWSNHDWPAGFSLSVCSPSSNQKPSSVLKEEESTFATFVTLKPRIFLSQNVFDSSILQFIVSKV